MSKWATNELRGRLESAAVTGEGWSLSVKRVTRCEGEVSLCVEEWSLSVRE